MRLSRPLKRDRVCAPEAAGALAARARRRGLQVRGVMGYEGHAMLTEDAVTRAKLVAESMDLLRAAHAQVGGDVISAGGTGGTLGRSHRAI